MIAYDPFHFNHMWTAMNYDIIGDIHGFADKLKDLLSSLGYSADGDGFCHPQRQVIFLGDFIDRGPKQAEVLRIVMAMVAKGAAQAVMGNHEFNALAFHTEHPPNSGQYLRPRSEKNTQQHKAFLQAFDGDASGLQEVLNWFMTLPLWLDLGGVRVIHACWHDASMNTLESQLETGNTLTEALLIKASDKNSKEYEAVEILLKGWEMEMPNGASYHDKGGHLRTMFRTRWWLNSCPSYQEVALPDVADKLSAEEPVVKALPGYDSNEPALFLGHYWMQGVPAVLADNVACVDYSAGKGGKLVAYRWDGEQVLCNDKFSFV